MEYDATKFMVQGYNEHIYYLQIRLLALVPGGKNTLCLRKDIAGSQERLNHRVYCIFETSFCNRKPFNQISAYHL
jgi:hypothetical protein